MTEETGGYSVDILNIQLNHNSISKFKFW